MFCFITILPSICSVFRASCLCCYIRTNEIIKTNNQIIKVLNKTVLLTEFDESDESTRVQPASINHQIYIKRDRWEGEDEADKESVKVRALYTHKIVLSNTFHTRQEQY